LAKLQLDRQIAQLRRTSALARGRPDEAAAQTTRLAYYDHRIERLQNQIDKLTVTAPFAGRLQPRMRMQTLVGLSMDKGVNLGTLIGRDTRWAVMVLPQEDRALVERGMAVEMRLWSEALATTRFGRVENVGVQFINELPHEALSSAYKGEVDTTPTDRNKSAPSTRSVLASIELDQPFDDAAPDGLTGRAKVTIGQTRLGTLQWRYIRKTLSLDWWL